MYQYDQPQHTENPLAKYINNPKDYVDSKNHKEILEGLNILKKKWSTYSEKAKKLVVLAEEILNDKKLTAEDKAEIKQLMDELASFQKAVNEALLKIEQAIDDLGKDSNASYNAFMDAQEIFKKYPNADRDFDVNLPE